MARTKSRLGSRRQTKWHTYAPVANTLAAATPEATDITSGLSNRTGMTILRVIGSIAWHGTTVDTAAAYFPGLLLGPNTLDAADMDPATDFDLDWLYWSAEGSRNPAYDGVDSFVEHHRWIDIKGRRKYREGDSLFFCENATGTGLVSYVKLRILLLLP